MANKNKVELTPEELAAKKIRKSNGWVRFWAILLAFVLTIGLFKTTMLFGDKITKASVAAGGSNTSEETTTPADDDTDSNDAGAAETTATAETTAAGDKAPAGTTVAGDKKPAGTTAANAFTKAEAVKLLNDATAKAANEKAGYSYAKNAAYVGDGLKLSVPKAIVSVIDAVLGKLKTPTSVGTVVGDFIGIGDLKGAVKKGTTEGKYNPAAKWGVTDFKKTEYLVGAKITEADITKVSKNGDTITLSLAPCQDPVRDQKSSMSRLTNDFITKQDVKDALANQKDVPATLVDEKTDVAYKNITVVANIKDGKIVSLKYSYNWHANVGIKAAGVTITGVGDAKTTINYTDFAY